MSTLIFVHGWSVTSTATYGELPQRVAQAAQAAGLQVRLAEVWLSEYVSFLDSVTMGDLVRAFDRALAALQLDQPFACVTHSTGGPVIREWLRAQRERPQSHSRSQLSHLVMLAPANYGSALAQLGKGTLGKLKAWWNGIEPGQRLLDWLALGSVESLALNLDHIHGADAATQGQYLFVLSGDRPDRKLYDHLNSYTGEDGSDGVVRLAAANLNSCHAVMDASGDGGSADTLRLQATRSPRSAFRLVAGAAHSGAEKGILQAALPEVVQAIVQCLTVRGPDDYRQLCDAFDAANAQRDQAKVELEPAGPFAPRVHIHDPRSLLIVRLGDEAGEPLLDARCLLTAGPEASADYLPQGFLLDRQANPRNPGVVSLFINHSLLAGDGRVADPRDARRSLRAPQQAHRPYGVRVEPTDIQGLVQHALAQSLARDDLLDVLGAHQTTVLDVVLPRRLYQGVFRLRPAGTVEDFRRPEPGPRLP